MSDIIRLQKKLVKGINCKYGCNVVLNCTAFHRKGNPFPVSIVKVSDTFVDEHGNFSSTPLYGSSSNIFILYYLRDLFAALEGDAIPPPSPEFLNSKNYWASRETIKDMVNIYGKKT